MLPLALLISAAQAAPFVVRLTDPQAATAIELTCSDGFRQRAPFVSGVATVDGAPARGCTAHFKGANIARWADVGSGMDLTCSSDGVRVSCSPSTEAQRAQRPAQSLPLPPRAPATAGGPAPAAAAAAAPLRVLLPGAPAGAAVELRCPSGASARAPVIDGAAVLPAADTAGCDLVLVGLPEPKVPASAGNPLRCEAVPATFRCSAR